MPNVTDFNDRDRLFIITATSTGVTPATIATRLGLSLGELMRSIAADENLSEQYHQAAAFYHESRLDRGLQNHHADPTASAAEQQALAKENY